MLAYCLYRCVGNQARPPVRGMDAVHRILRVGDTLGNAVEHLVKGDKFVAQFQANFVYDFQLLVENLAHAQFVGRGKKERLQEKSKERTLH